MSAFHSRLRKHCYWKATQIRADRKINLRHNLRSATHRALFIFKMDCSDMVFLTWKNAVNEKTEGKGWLFSDKPEKFIKHCFILNISLGEYKYNIDLISGWILSQVSKRLSEYLSLKDFFLFCLFKKDFVLIHVEVIDFEGQREPYRISY